MRSTYNTLLEAVIVGLLLSMFMAYAALDHNPQQEFFDADAGRVITENLLPVMVSWFLAAALPYGVLRAIVALLLEKLRRQHP